MPRTLILTLPNEMLKPLPGAAQREGRSLDEIVALERLIHGLEQAHNLRQLADLFGAASLGRPSGSDNESIDRDLAREYGWGQ